MVKATIDCLVQKWRLCARPFFDDNDNNKEKEEGEEQEDGKIGFQQFHCVWLKWPILLSVHEFWAVKANDILPSLHRMSIYWLIP